VNVAVEEGGSQGSLRWDFSVPFETYQWEPLKVMQIEESYGAGFKVDRGGTDTDDEENKSDKSKEDAMKALGSMASVAVDGGATLAVSSLFSEGGMIADLTAGATIQSKGFVNQSFKIESQYTATLYKWQMLVQSGGQDMHY
jgi:hypothetical protein